jgi:hypothetical protein
MSNLSQRLSRLELPPQHNQFLTEVGERLFRYGIETRHQVQIGKVPAMAWSEVEEQIYQHWRKEPSFDTLEREILARGGEVS